MAKRIAVLLAVLALTCGCSSSSRLGDATEPFDQHLRESAFNFYWEILNEGYPFFGVKGIDWKDSHDRYFIHASLAETRRDFYFVLASMLSELQDPHVSLKVSKSLLDQDGITYSHPRYLARLIEGRLIVTGWPGGEVPESPASLRDQNFVYPEIRRIEGSRPSQLIDHLSRGVPGSEVELELGWSDGTVTRFSSKRPETKPGHSKKRPNDARRDSMEDVLHVSTFAQLGYLRIRSFDHEGVAGIDLDGFASAFDAAIDHVIHTRGLIVDLRENLGGQIALMARPLARLFPQKLVLFNTITALRLRESFFLNPIKPTYAGKVVVLTGSSTASAGEHFARILQREGRAQIVGVRTTGAEAMTHSTTGPDGAVLTFGKFPLVDDFGRGIQGSGVVPDYHVGGTWRMLETIGVEAFDRLMQNEPLRKALELLDCKEEFSTVQKALCYSQNLFEDASLGERGDIPDR